MSGKNERVKMSAVRERIAGLIVEACELLDQREILAARMASVQSRLASDIGQATTATLIEFLTSPRALCPQCGEERIVGTDIGEQGVCLSCERGSR